METEVICVDLKRHAKLVVFRIFVFGLGFFIPVKADRNKHAPGKDAPVINIQGRQIVRR